MAFPFFRNSSFEWGSSKGSAEAVPQGFAGCLLLGRIASLNLYVRSRANYVSESAHVLDGHLFREFIAQKLALPENPVTQLEAFKQA
jgi:hypothetical protein